jgi:hypothetical protein
MNLEARILDLESEHEALLSVRIAQIEQENVKLRIRALERENRHLKLLSQPKAETLQNKDLGGKTEHSERVPERNAMSFEALQHLPAFKAFCRRRGPRFPDGWAVKAMPMAQRLAEATKKRRGEFKAFCRPRGVLSILKDGPYPTGRLTKDGLETLKIRKLGDEWVSEDPWESETVSQIQVQEIENDEEAKMATE